MSRPKGIFKNHLTDIVAFALPMVEDDIPSTYMEAMGNSESLAWKEAMDEKIMSLHRNQTRELVHLSNKNKGIGHKWVYTKKDL